MFTYLLTWFLLAMLALAFPRKVPVSLLFLIGVYFTLFIGLRFEVGGDWVIYGQFVSKAFGSPFLDIFNTSEFGYELLNWLGANWGGGIFLVNLICGLIFSIGLLSFCHDQPRPLLALTLAFPYLILVVAMGYSRQGVAIGIEMLALLALQRERNLQFVALVFLASSFHRPALLLMLLPVTTLSSSMRFSQFLRLSLLAFAAYGFYSSSFSGEIDVYVQNYIGTSYSSDGALLRVSLCFLPAITFLFNRHYFQLSSTSLRIWSLLSLMAVAAFVGLFTVASSTAVDRIALYLIPLQLFVGSRLPDTNLFGLDSSFWNFSLISFSFAVLLVWLFLANHAYAWLPYQNLLLLN